MTPPISETAAAARLAVREGKRAGPIVLLGMTVLVLAVAIGWLVVSDKSGSADVAGDKTGLERLEKRVSENAARITATEGAATAALAEVNAVRRETKAELEAIRREQSRQGAQIDRVLERLPPR